MQWTQETQSIIICAHCKEASTLVLVCYAISSKNILIASLSGLMIGPLKVSDHEEMGCTTHPHYLQSLVFKPIVYRPINPLHHENSLSKFLSLI
ncbi:hypothetical protein J6590_082392 [Homalodisca vitripennis]|nr:hypothetical protein J6590_082392 [Homalodisca vitripennis]